MRARTKDSFSGFTIFARVTAAVILFGTAALILRNLLWRYDPFIDFAAHRSATVSGLVVAGVAIGLCVVVLRSTLRR